MFGIHNKYTQLAGSVASRVSHGRVSNEGDLVAPIMHRARQLESLTPEQLQENSATVRALVNHKTVDAAEARIEAFAAMFEALRRARRIRLYEPQLHAALVLAGGAIAEMQTGEGKTFACAPAAYLHSLTGRGVHVATPNTYLSERDCELLAPAYRQLGVDVAALPEQSDPADKRQAYRCDITYGTGYEFGFDYLRDQLALRVASQRPLGTGVLESLGGGDAARPLIQRGLYYSIVDEVDNVLLDDAASPLILSGAVSGEAPDADVHRAARRMISTLVEGKHFRVEASGGDVELTEAGTALVHEQDDWIPIRQLVRTWVEYIEQALRANLLRRDVHYVVAEDSTIQIVDMGTGRIFTDRAWSCGLHQAVEAKEEVPITPEKQAVAQITRQRFSRLYHRLAGTTGTARGCEREFSQVYRLPVKKIPLRLASRRSLWPMRCFSDQQRKFSAIAESVCELHVQQRPVLVGTQSIAASEELALLFQQRGLAFQLLNGRQDAAEAAVVEKAGQMGAITIATSLAGRGTDIPLCPGVDNHGGLHVIVSEGAESARIDRQLVGRCARQGDPGSAQTFIAADDSLIVNHGAWLAAMMTKYADPDGEIRVNLTRQVRRIQRAAERTAYSARSALLRRDLARDSIDSQQPLSE